MSTLDHVTSTADLTVTTTREQFRALAAVHRFVPVTRKVLADSETPLSAYRKLAANRPGTFLLESAENGRSWSRWSFIGAGAPSALTVRDGEAAWIGVTPQDAPRGGDPLEALRATMDLLASEHLADLPPLSGGLVGFFAYDMVRRLERLPSLAVDDLKLPDMLLLLATDMAAVDHHEGTITLIANAVNWNGTDERVDWAYDDAVARLDVMTQALGQPLPSTVATFDRPEPVHRAQRTLEEYSAIVERLVGEIEAGEAFQVVPSQRFEMDTNADPIDVYRMLRVSNPSPYMYLLNIPKPDGDIDFSIVGSSPEALVTVKDGWAHTHPDRGHPLARRHRRGRPAAGEGAALRREGARRAPDAGGPGPQRPRSGVRSRHRARRRLQPHRAVQPRHAPGLDGHRPARRGPHRAGRRHRLLPGRHAVRAPRRCGRWS